METNNFGHILSKIRKSKGLTQSEASSNIITRAYLSQLESNKNKISLEVFIKLLDKYNVSLSEFEYLLQEEQEVSIKINYLKDIQTWMYQCNNQDIEQYLSRFNCVKKDIYSYEYHMKLLGKSLLLYRHKGKVAPCVYQDLMTYVFSVDIWGLYELHLLVNLVGIIDYKDSQVFYRYVEKKLSQARFPEKDKLLAQLYLNLSNTAVNVNDYQSVYQFVEKGLTYTQKYHYIFEQILLQINLCIAKSIQNIDLDKTIYHYLNMLEYLGYPKIIQQVKKELHKHNFNI